MKRTLVDLNEQDLSQLDELAKAQEASRASVLRDAVTEYLVKRERVPATQPKPLRGFGALKGYFQDGQAWQDNLRTEWE